MAPIYGLAEKAADLILNPPAPGSSNSPTKTTSGGSQTGKPGDDGAAAGLFSFSSPILGLAATVAVILSAL